jgi:hypothetical protein
MLRWVLAVLITLGAATYQRLTGPTYPWKDEVSVGERTLRVKLLRAHSGEGDQPVRIEGAWPELAGRILWRRFPTNEPFVVAPMRFEAGNLTGALPHQPPAGKIEYRIELASGADTAFAPGEGNVVTRFKGSVHPGVLVPHIFFMFFAMLLSNRTGIEALRGGDRLRSLSLATLVFLLAGGFVFGPVVQKQAFGAWWTGFPFGFDLTDNKTLLALIGWVTALFSLRRTRSPRSWVIAAAVLMLVVFLIPHSLLGSERKPM